MEHATWVRMWDTLTAVKQARIQVADATRRLESAESMLRLSLREMDDDNNRAVIPEHIEDRRVIDDHARNDEADSTTDSEDAEEV